MKKIILLLLFCTSMAFSQFTIDTTIVARQSPFDPSLTNMRSAYFLTWEKTVKDTLIYLRPKQYFSITVKDTLLRVTLDSIVGTGTKRISYYKAKYAKDSLSFKLPYTLVHDPNVSFDAEPVFRWTKGTGTGTILYQLQVSTDSLFKVKVINDSALVDTTRHSLGRLQNGTTYFVRVRVNNQAWSKLGTITTYEGMKIQFADRFLIFEPVLITNSVNPLNRQVQLRVRYHKIPYF